MRWFVGVPIGTNPFILRDFARTACILWVVVAALVAAAQLFVGGSLGGAQILGAASFAGYMVLCAAAAFALVAFLLFQNRYVALYRFFDDAVYCESMRARGFALMEAAHAHPFPVEPPEGRGRSATKVVPWREVRGFVPMKSSRAIDLKGTRGTLLRIYCPDDAVYEQALACVQERAAGSSNR